MKLLFKIILFLIIFIVPCLANDLSELRDYLITKGRANYFPKDGEYKKLPDVCNKEACFQIVTVYYVSKSMHGNRRLAIFSSSGNYLGCYSGLNDLPIGVEDNKIKFIKSEYGDTAIFEGSEPPKSIWIDGEVFEFEKTL